MQGVANSPEASRHDDISGPITYKHMQTEPLRKTVKGLRTHAVMLTTDAGSEGERQHRDLRSGAEQLLGCALPAPPQKLKRHPSLISKLAAPSGTAPQPPTLVQRRGPLSVLLTIAARPSRRYWHTCTRAVRSHFLLRLRQWTVSGGFSRMLCKLATRALLRKVIGELIKRLAN